MSDREKQIADLLRNAVRGEADGTTIPVPVEDCWVIATALAAPPEVDEAKLAEVLREHGWCELTNRCECGERPADMELHQAAKIAELLRGEG